jgi:hypothetical protein
MRPKAHPLYVKWHHMRDRCRDTTRESYGGRGIRFHPGWEDFWQFVRDIEALGPRPSPRHSLDRIDNNGHYEPGNVQWATHTEQCRNRRSAKTVPWNGQTVTVADLADELGVTYIELWSRMRHYDGDMAKVMASVEKLKREGPKPLAKKLTDEAIQAMREAYDAGRSTKAALAREFNVSKSTAGRLVDERWRNAG